MEQQTRDYYSQWIGVKAPEFAPVLRDRGDDARKLLLRNYAGRRLLLISFDTGNFVDGPSDEGATIRLLRVLDATRKQQGTNLAVIGFTAGPMFFSPVADPSVELMGLTGFPIVNINELRRDQLQEPYNLLQRWPSMVLVDARGVISGVWSPPLVESNIADALLLSRAPATLRLPPEKAPAQAVTDWSWRKFWVMFAYTTNLSAGSEFQKGFGAMSTFYFSDEVPDDNVSGLKALVGKRLRTSVKSNDVIRASHFDN